MYGRRLQVPNRRLCGVTVKNKLKAYKVLSGYYHSRDTDSFRQCLLELLAIIATSYEEVEEELSFLRQAVLGEDRRQTKLR
jgi:hypothetical protein